MVEESLVDLLVLEFLVPSKRLVLESCSLVDWLALVFYSLVDSLALESCSLVD